MPFCMLDGKAFCSTSLDAQTVHMIQSECGFWHWRSSSSMHPVFCEDGQVLSLSVP